MPCKVYGKVWDKVSEIAAKQPLSDTICDALKKDILDGVLKPGQRLMEIQYARKLGVSRTPFREAVRRLEIEGLVTVLPRRGAHVSNLSRRDISNVLDIRSALDMLAAGLFVMHKTDGDIVCLKQIESAFETAANENDIQGQILNDVKFHEYIYSKTGNEKLISLYAGFKDQLYRYRALYLKEENYTSLIAKEHNQLIEAFETDNLKKSKQISEKHIANQKKNLTEA